MDGRWLDGCHPIALIRLTAHQNQITFINPHKVSESTYYLTMMLFRSMALLTALFTSANAFVVPGSNRLQDVSLYAKSDAESLRKKEFVAIMAEELGSTKTDAEAALSCALDIISEVSNVCSCAL